MKYELAIFDLDGTILDTLCDLTNSVNYALSGAGLPLRKPAEVRSFLGRGIRNLIECCVGENGDLSHTDTAFNLFKAHYKEHCLDFTRPYEHIVELVKTLKNRGVYTAVISNKADFAVQDLCKRFFDGLFDHVAGEIEGVRKKPYPDSVYNAMQKLDVKPEKTVYIGDSEVDVTTAENANIPSIIVTWGFRDEPDLVKAGAKTVVHTVLELEKELLGE